MKTKKILPVIFTMMMILLITACGKNKNGDDKNKDVPKVCGSWAYIHDKETEAAVFNKDGTAKYENKDYTYTCDDQFINLKDSDGNEKKVRYLMDDKGMYLYSNNTYTYVGDGEPDGIEGKWECQEKHWTYIFSYNGAFSEDDIFQGTYKVDQENSTFTLTYNGEFEDTTCYFQLDNDKLAIEYPWQMVKTGSK